MGKCKKCGSTNVYLQINNKIVPDIDYMICMDCGHKDEVIIN